MMMGMADSYVVLLKHKSSGNICKMKIVIVFYELQGDYFIALTKANWMDSLSIESRTNTQSPRFLVRHGEQLAVV